MCVLCTRSDIFKMNFVLNFWMSIRDEKLNRFFLFCYSNILILPFWTYSTISWWCRMHEFNFTCKSQFATVWTCSSSCPLWGVICCCLISSMAAFSLSNWVYATEIRVVTRDKYPHTTPSPSSNMKHWKEINIQDIKLCKIEANKE